MTFSQCPGQNKRFWKPADIFEVRCPDCKKVIEFWKDDLKRGCHHCGKVFANPKLDLGCAEWCKYADQCFVDEPPAKPKKESKDDTPDEGNATAT